MLRTWPPAYGAGASLQGGILRGWPYSLPRLGRLPTPPRSLGLEPLQPAHARSSFPDMSSRPRAAGTGQVSLPEAGSRIPAATYRLQFNAGYGFAQASSLVPYLHALGITDLYASPLLAARQGSPHGYDIIDPTRLNPELGGEEGFRLLADALQRHGMGLVLDIVPNHMAASPENPWWLDVLRHGPESPYAGYFAIDWQPPWPGRNGRLLLPVLGQPFGIALEAGELKLELDADGFWLTYYDQRFPLNPESYSRLLSRRLDRLTQRLGAGHPAVRQLTGLIATLFHPSEGATWGAWRPTRRQEADFRAAFGRAREDLWRLYTGNAAVRAYIAETLEIYNGHQGEPESFALLEELLAGQAWQLALWRVALREINYRRFFDVSDLVCLRMEREEVFSATHALVLELVRAGQVTGLRIDHLDGLYDPSAYLARLQESLAHSCGPGGREKNETRPTAKGDPGFYVVVEKILSSDEELPRGWPVHGTTGYDFLNVVNGLLVDPEGMGELKEIYARLTGPSAGDNHAPDAGEMPVALWRHRQSMELSPLFSGEPPRTSGASPGARQQTPGHSSRPDERPAGPPGFTEVAYTEKKRVMAESFAGDVRRLAWHLARLAGDDRHGADLTLEELEDALVEVTAHLPVYRTYIRDPEVSEPDRQVIAGAVAAAIKRRPALERAGKFLRRVLLLEFPPGLTPAGRQEWLRFIMRWQQFAPPVTAKGVEDTALYRYNCLLSLNEVGGEPDSRGVTVAEFHRRNAARQQRWPHTLNATSTHDTKRGEDVRARLDVLSEIPHLWARHLDRWRGSNQGKKPRGHGRPIPDANTELFLYQTLLGAWPLNQEEIPAFKERLGKYLVKVAREAKEFTSWHQPDPEYEEALVKFAMDITGPSEADPFLADFLGFQEVIAGYGALNSLAQVLLKITSPGIPDFYQGTELWDFSLVDPDNRRPVDFRARERLLNEIRESEWQAAGLASMLQNLLVAWQDGRVKLYLIYQSLNCRRAHQELFACGEYIPLTPKGEHRENICAFARRLGDIWALVVVPRLLARVWVRKNPQAETPPPVNPLAGWPSLAREVFSHTALLLPPEAPERWQNLFTAETVSAPPQPGPGPASPRVIPLAAALDNFPVAILTHKR